MIYRVVHSGGNFKTGPILSKTSAINQAEAFHAKDVERQKRDGGTWSTHYTVVSIETVYSTDGLDPATHPKPGDAR